MITFTTWPKPNSSRDVAVCSWNGQECRCEATSACSTLARTLVSIRCPDQPWQALDRTRNRILFGNSTHRLAQIVAQEDGRTIRWRKFTP